MFDGVPTFQNVNGIQYCTSLRTLLRLIGSKHLYSDADGHIYNFLIYNKYTSAVAFQTGAGYMRYVLAVARFFPAAICALIHHGCR